MKHNLILAAAVSLAMASTAMAQTSSDTTSGASSGTSATTETTASPGMLQMSEAEKSTTATWSGAIADAFFTDSAMTELKSGTEIRSAWSSLTPEQQSQVEQDCSTMQTAAAGTMPTTGSDATTGTSTDTTASTSGTTGTTTGTSGETTASTSTDTSGSASPVTDPTTVAQLCDFVGSM